VGPLRQHRLFWVSVLGLCSIALLCGIAGVTLGEIAVHPVRERSQPINQAQIFPPGLPVKEQAVEIHARDGITLRATYALSTVSDNQDTVILLHGVHDNRTGMTGFARLFLQHGYRALLPDSRAHGYSEGEFASYGVLERDDVHRWVDWVSVRSPGHCVYGMGESMGAAILVQSVGVDHRFCAAVAESSFATFRQVADIRIGQFTHTSPWLGETFARPMIDVALAYVRFRYAVDLQTANPIDGVTRSCTPVLLIHGLADSNIPPVSSIELHNAAPDTTKLWLVRGAGHCGASAVAKEQFDDAVLEWFGTHNRPCGV
jgi:uncharacterized protein